MMKKVKNAEKGVIETDFPSLDILPANFTFRKLDLLLSDNHKNMFTKILNRFAKDYHYFFIDCPANIGKTMEEIIPHCHLVVLPLIPTPLSMISFDKMKDFFSKRAVPEKKLCPFFSMVDKRKKMHKNLVENMIPNNDLFLKNFIPYSSAVEKMGTYRAPLTHQHPNSSLTQTYLKLWDEIKHHQ